MGRVHWNARRLIGLMALAGCMSQKQPDRTDSGVGLGDWDRCPQFVDISGESCLERFEGYCDPCGNAWFCRGNSDEGPLVWGPYPVSCGCGVDGDKPCFGCGEHLDEFCN